MDKSVDIPYLQACKAQGRKLAMVTAYDCAQARLADAAGVDLILVGDSLWDAVLGYDSPAQVSMEDMVRHTAAVSRGAKRALVVGDLPFGSYQLGPEQALVNALRLVREGGCRAVSLEGGLEAAPLVAELTRRQIPVLGHIGLLPQTAGLWGDFTTQGRDEESAWQLTEAAQALEEAGAFAVIVECVTADAARLISERLDIPTIGIGSGVDCDGQLLLFHDLLGITDGHAAKFVKRFAEGGDYLRQGLADFCAQVRAGAYPGPEHSLPMNKDEAKRLY